MNVDRMIDVRDFDLPLIYDSPVEGVGFTKPNTTREIEQIREQERIKHVFTLYSVDKRGMLT